MKPILIIPPDTIDAEGIKALNDNGICTVVATDPSKVKFVDPIPAVSSRSEIETAAIALSRKLLTQEAWTTQKSDGSSYWKSLDRTDVWQWYIEALAKGTPLDANYVDPVEKVRLQNNEDERVSNRARQDELQKIAREEARAEAAQRKAEREAAKKAKSKC